MVSMVDAPALLPRLLPETGATLAEVVDRLQRAARSAADRRRLAAAIRDSAPGIQETDWLEWKSTLDLSTPADRFEVARFVLGAANRDPERAAADAEGTAYLAAGVEPGIVHGIERRDVAQIEDAVSRFIGTDDDAPAWSAQYTELDGRDVLVITVEAPRQGDPIRTLRRGFGTFVPGDIFMRRPGQTRKATPDEVRMLSRRLAANTADELNVDVDWRLRSTEIRVVDVSPAAAAAWVRREQRLLAGADETMNDEAVRNVLLQRGDEYAQDVTDYLKGVVAVLPDMADAAALTGSWAALAPAVTNNSDRFLEGGRLELFVPVLGARLYSYPEAPERQSRSWPQRPRRFSGFLESMLSSPSWPAFHPIDVDLAGGGLDVRPGIYGPTVVWSGIDVHARTAEDAGELYVVFPPTYAGQTLELRWRMTARSTDGERSGALTVETPSTVLSVLDLVPRGPD